MKPYLVRSEGSIRGCKVGTEWNACIDAGLHEEGATLPDIGMITDGDGAV